MTNTNTDGEGPPSRMPWDPRPAPSSIISAEPLVRDEAESASFEWTARSGGASGGPVPGAPGFVFGNTVARLVAFVLDTMLVFLVAAVLGAIFASVLSLDPGRDVAMVNGLVYGLATAVSAVYFVASWASGRRATPGMRAFRLQVARGPEGRPLTPATGLVRWAVMGFPLQLLLIVPVLAGVASLASLVLPMVLLVSTRLSPARRGLHDRAAGSVIVQPENQEMTAVLACLVVVVLVLVASVLAIAALVLLGGQIQPVRRAG